MGVSGGNLKRACTKSSYAAKEWWGEGLQDPQERRVWSRDPGGDLSPQGTAPTSLPPNLISILFVLSVESFSFKPMSQFSSGFLQNLPFELHPHCAVSVLLFQVLVSLGTFLPRKFITALCWPPSQTWVLNFWIVNLTAYLGLCFYIWQLTPQAKEWNGTTFSHQTKIKRSLKTGMEDLEP